MNFVQAQAYQWVLKTTGCPVRARRAAQLAARGGRLARTPQGGKKPWRGKTLPAANGREPGDGLDAAIAALESEAVRRALSGVDVPVFHQGRECGSTVKHSDQLLMFLLKTLRPERYGAGKDAPAARRPVALDVDLSAAAEDCGEADSEDEDAGEG